MNSKKFLINNLSAINDVQDTDLVLMERNNTSYKSQFYNFNHLKNLSVENGIINKLNVDDKGDIIEFINSSIEHNVSFYVTRDAEGHPFANYSELSTATNSLSSKLSDEWELYIGGIKKRPSNNDYCVVLSDESLPEEYKHSELSIQYTTRYSWVETSDSKLSGRWEFKYIINNSPYTKMQWDAINSGVTKEWKEITDTLENSFNDKLDILLEKLDSLESRVMDYEGNMNCLDYGSTLSFRLDKGKNLSSDSMPYDCQLQFPYRNGYRYGNYLSVDGYAMEDKMIQATSSMYYCNIACGQDVFFNNHITSDYLNINIIPYQYGRIGNNTDISTLNLQDLKENSTFHITRCLYVGSGSTNMYLSLSDLTQITDFENTNIYERDDKFLEYRLLIELSASRNSIINISDLDTPYVMTTQNGKEVKPSLEKTYSVYNGILPESTRFSNVSNKDIITYNSIVVPEGQFIYLKYIIKYKNPFSAQWVKYPSFSELFNGNAYIGPLNIHII